MEESHHVEKWEGYVDWRNRPAFKGRHGGMLAAFFVLVVEVLENLAFLANASNLVIYMTTLMHFPIAKSANTVTNFMGTAFLLAILGGFLSDAFLTTYQMYLTSAFIEFLGLVLLTVQARSPSLKPAACEPKIMPCHEVDGGNAAMLFIGLYMIALGVGGIKGSLPIFGCTIMLNCCLAQLSTYSVEQAATMNTKLGSLKIPPASLPVFPVVFIMIMAPIYDHFIVPISRKYNKTEMGITHLQRIGIGLVLSIIAMAIAAVVEVKRKRLALILKLADSKQPLPLTFFWIAIQFLFLGSADLFTLAGLLEFFFTEAPSSMRSLATSLSWTSLAFGYYLSSVIVSIVNSVTGKLTHHAWFEGHNLNHYRLEYFYGLMCVLSVLNFLHYLYWAHKYKYRSTSFTM